MAEIAALVEGTRDVLVGGCEPGFYYTLYGADSLPKCGGLGETALPDGAVYRAEPCGVDGWVTFDEVMKPSAAAGFFTIGVSATKGE